MANTRSAKKMVRKIATRTAVNTARRSRMRTYVRRVEELIGCPVSMVSTSPEREDVILMRDPFKA